MVYYKRNLPHYQPEGYAYFITTRLAGTIPKEIFEKIKNEYERGLRLLAEYKDDKTKKDKYRELHRINFVKYENILDSFKYGYKWLGDKRIAQIISDSLHYYDGTRYDLIAYTIMPNHIHLVIFPFVERDSSRSIKTNDKELSDINVALQKPVVTRIMRLFKGSTARKANKILNRKGRFWQHESYDHVVRDKNELRRIVKYILSNPEKAGLCETADDWDWNYLNPKYLA